MAEIPNALRTGPNGRLPIRACLAVVVLLLAVPPASAKSRRGEITEDSLQTLVAQEPENPSHWIQLGTLAVKGGLVDLAKGYFDEAIKLSSRDGSIILQVGNIWLTHGWVKASLTYLMPNLAHLDSAKLDKLQGGLEMEKMFSVQLIVLRHLAARTPAFLPFNRKAALLAFHLGDYPLCQSILLHAHAQLDYESARNLLLVNFFLGTAMEPKALDDLTARYRHGEIHLLAALNHAQAGRWKEARAFLSREAKSPAYRDYYQLGRGLEAAADDRPEDAAAHFEYALGTRWDRLKVVVYADLYRLYSTTGNKFKSDQVWESLKEEYQAKDPDLQAFMARQLQVRGYEKQSRYFWRVVLRRRPGDVQALTALWDDLMEKEDEQILLDNLEAALDKDPLSCEANTLAMNFHYRMHNDQDLLPFARNATIYCFETLEPYYVLGATLLNLSKPDEARQHFATYIRKGGDANRVPLSLR
ncbi:MAG TPA: hypothetical protein VK465_12390 [Fibrobacteria bacterium]|nr:hypothetical protein [Fibrobacteria bacterium]